MTWLQKRLALAALIVVEVLHLLFDLSLDRPAAIAIGCVVVQAFVVFFVLAVVDWVGRAEGIVRREQ